jgi:Zn-dependent membrane protease YugP
MGGFVLAMFTGSAFGYTIAWVGLILYGAAFLFTVITLPVEYDASRRAIKLLRANGMVNESEVGGAKKVLDAAALTYVAAMAAALMNILYWASLLGGRRD